MKTTLLIMAAGLGSRYGGNKQIDHIGPHGEILLEYSIYDAMAAGFDKVVFVIKRSMADTFRELIGDKIAKKVEVEYAYQEYDSLPDGFVPPEGRTKPYGTVHAVLVAKDLIHEPFAVINADDYYGKAAFKEIYNYLSAHADDGKYRYCMVGYELGKTVTDNGSVARGVCQVNEKGYLESVVERTKIEKQADGVIRFTEDGSTWAELPEKTTVSMNMWGFTPSFAAESEARFPAFLDRALAENPMKGEYFLPSTVSALLAEDKATVKMLYSPDKWYGVTYAADKPVVVAALKAMTEAGLYPDGLWK